METKHKKNYYDKKEELIIIKQYQELMLYVYQIIKKFPDTEILSLVKDIKDNLFLGLENLIFAKKYKNNSIKLNYLLKVETHLNIMKVLKRICFF